MRMCTWNNLSSFPQTYPRVSLSTIPLGRDYCAKNVYTIANIHRSSRQSLEIPASGRHSLKHIYHETNRLETTLSLSLSLAITTSITISTASSLFPFVRRSLVLLVFAGSFDLCQQGPRGSIDTFALLRNCRMDRLLWPVSSYADLDRHEHGKERPRAHTLCDKIGLVALPGQTVT